MTPTATAAAVAFAVVPAATPVAAALILNWRDSRRKGSTDDS